MKILVATDGTLDPKATTRMVSHLVDPGAAVDVVTVINVPHEFLQLMGEIGGGWDAATVARAGGPAQVGMTGGDREATRLAGRGQPVPSRGKTIVEDYIAGERDRRTGPLATALTEAGFVPKVTFRESDRTADAIVEAARRAKSNVICIGATGRGEDPGSLGATATKVVRRAPCTVVVIR